jgi:hypothetical protein
MKTVQERQADRFRFLKRLYEVTNADIFSMGQLDEIGRELGLTSDDALAIAQYFTAKNLIEWRATQGLLSLTQWGVDEVETALAHPQEPTAYFPPVASLNIIVAESINNSPVQQGNTNSTQVQSISSQDRDAIRALLESLKVTVAGLQLAQDLRSDAEAHLATVEAQLRASNPKRSIIRESLSTLADILKTAGAAATVVEGVKLLLSSIGGG